MIDYATSGLSIQSAMVDMVKRFPKPGDRPNHILWGGFEVRTGDSIPCGEAGIVVMELIHYAGEPLQGVDLKVDPGFQLSDGSTVPLLRTWADPNFEEVVEYPYRSKDHVLRTWNVFRRTLPNGEVQDEKWTGNAGFWVEEKTPTERIYHCSHGMAEVPDFNALTYRVTVRPTRT